MNLSKSKALTFPPVTTQTVEVSLTPDGHEKRVITKTRVTRSVRTSKHNDDDEIVSNQSTLSPSTQSILNQSIQSSQSQSIPRRSETLPSESPSVSRSSGTPDQDLSVTRVTTVVNRRRYVNGKLVMETREEVADSGKNEEDERRRLEIPSVNQNEVRYAIGTKSTVIISERHKLVGHFGTLHI